MAGKQHLRGWTQEALVLARIYDLTAAVWIDKKKRPEPLTPVPPPEPSTLDPRSVEALLAFLT